LEVNAGCSDWVKVIVGLNHTQPVQATPKGYFPRHKGGWSHPGLPLGE
jgi:hypothetical protein